MSTSKFRPEQITRARKARGMSQVALAVAAKLHPSTVRLAEEGVGVAPATVERLARALDLEVKP